MKICNKLGCIIVFLVCIMFCLTGCEEDEYPISSSPEQTAETQSGDTSGLPEYNYEEFVNDTPQDPSVLEEDDDPISYEDARKSVEEVEHIDGSLEKFEKQYKKKAKIKPDNISDYLDEVQQHLYESNPEEVSYYERDEDSIRIYLQSGGVYIYQPELEGIDAAGNARTMEIATYQPYFSDYGKSVQQYMKYPDDAASMISNAFEMYNFQNDGSESDHNYDDMEVSLENILKFSENNIVLWHGHGGHNKKNGCYLGTGIRTSKESRKKYAQDIREETLLFGKGGTYWITAAFIEKYFSEESLKNSIIYLATCKSGADDSLVNALLSKGAMAVFANDGDIHTKYNLSMMKTVFERAVQKNGEHYYTLEEALDYAKSQHGREDGQGTETHLYYQEGYHDVSLDWYENYKTAERDVVLVLDRSGSMGGNPLDQTKYAADKFVDTVLQEDSRVALVTYDEEVKVHSGFTRDGSLLHEEIEGIDVGSSTNIYAGLSSADQLLQSSYAKKKIIVLMTDGLPNAGMDENGSYEDALITYAEKLKKQGYDLYTLGFFSSLGEERLAAQKLLEGMASPGYHYEVGSAEDLVFFFNDMANQISGARYVYIRIACPVDVKIQSQGETLSSEQDEQKTRTSFGSLSFEETEEGDPAKILRLDMEKNYDVHITGYDTGKMTYTVSYPNQSGEYSDVRSFPDITVSDGMCAMSSTERSDVTSLQVDSDGDGKYETTYETESNGVMKEKKDYTILYICIGIGAGVVFLVIIIIIVGVKSFKRRKRREKYSSMPSFNHDIPPEELKHQMASKAAAGNTVMSKAVGASDMPNVTGQIEGLFGAYQGKKYPVTAGIMYKIGRDGSCDIQVTHQQISRIHCKVQLMPDRTYQLTDCSSNGTYYNNIHLEKNKTYSLPKGAIIVLGDPNNVLQLN